MSRFEGKFEANAGGSLNERELAALLAADSLGGLRRSCLVATCLSAGTGWRDAAVVLGGAFAGGGGVDETGLNEGKEQ